MSLTKVSYSMIAGAPINVLDFGAVGDGVTNDSAAFIAARTAAAGRKIYVPAGTYKLNQAITSSEDLILEGDGPSTILDFTGTVTGGSYALEAIGTATQIQNLSATAPVAILTLTFVSAPSLVVGDVFVIFNPTTFSWSGFRSNYFAGEWCQVESVVGNTVTLTNPLYDTYLAANVSVYKISSPKVVLKNFQIKGTTIFGLINTTLCIAPLIENITATHANNSIIELDRTYKATITNPNIYNEGDGGDDYGIVVGNSQHTRILAGNIFARRHAVTTGGGSAICSVSVRDCRTIGSVIKNDAGSGIFAADFHGNTEDSSYIDCTIYGGASWQGKDVEYVNCVIHSDSGGRVIYSAEMKGGKFGLKNCHLVTYVNPQPTTRGIIDIGGNNEPVDVNTVLDCAFYVQNCTLYGRNLSAATTAVLFINRGSSVNTNFVIDGFNADVNLLGQVLLTNSVSGTPASEYIIVDNISGFPSGTILNNVVGGGYQNFPHRCQKQVGRLSLTTSTSASFVIATPVSFKYPYPKVPAAFASSGGASGQTYLNNRPAIANLYQVTANAITPQIMSGDSATNWSAAVEVGVSWSAMIDEV